LLLCVNVDHELTPVHVCPVDKQCDTGQYSLDVILDKIATGTDFGIDALVPIYNAFSKVGEGTSAKLRHAIGLRLQKEGAIDSEHESDVVEIESDASV